MQFEAISLCPIISQQRNEVITILTATSCLVAVENNEVSPQPPLLQTKQPYFPQLLLICPFFQPLYELCHSSLHEPEQFNIPHAVRGPKLNTVIKVQSHQCPRQGNNHFPSPAGHAFSDKTQEAIGLLRHLDTLVVHVQLAADQHFMTLLGATKAGSVIRYKLEFVVEVKLEDSFSSIFLQYLFLLQYYYFSSLLRQLKCLHTKLSQSNSEAYFEIIHTFNHTLHLLSH